MAQVRTVECPECKRIWTGQFKDDDKRDKVRCKDCIQREIDEKQAKE